MTPSTATVIASLLPPADDPFRYGWRYLRHEHPDGRVDFEQVALTLADVLHPQEGDFIVQSQRHDLICSYLANVLRAQLSGDPNTLVASDLRIAWDVPELEAHGSDIALIFGLRERKNWSTFAVAEEGVRPALIIEVTSPTTRQIDLVNKRDEYDLAGVARYVIVDVTERRGQPLVRLLGYQQVADIYEVLPPDARGRLWLEPVGLWIGVEEGEVYCYDAQGTRLGDYAEIAAALEAERLTLEAERQARRAAEQRAAEAEARAQALEAELRRLRGEQYMS